MAKAIKTPHVAKPNIKEALPLIIAASCIGAISFIGLLINMFVTTAGG